jgi:hypothetical protein
MPHITYREADRIKDKTIFNRPITAGLAYPKWGRQKYPRDS